VGLHVRPLDRDATEARVDASHGGKMHRLHAPMSTDDARYLAKIVETYEAERSA
jgi:hypothetical protein